MTLEEQSATRLSIRQAAFIGVGAMVGAGIFALLGTAGAVAGAAVWVSVLLAGVVAGLQGYSYGKLGARYPAGAYACPATRPPGRGRAGPASSASTPAAPPGGEDGGWFTGTLVAFVTMPSRPGPRVEGRGG